MPIGAKAICCLYLLVPKPLFESLYQGLPWEKQLLEPVSYIEFDIFMNGFFLKERSEWNSSVYHLVSNYFNIKFIIF